MIVYSLVWRVCLLFDSRVADCIIRAKTSAGIVSDVAQIRLIGLTYSLISRIAALQGTLVMIRVSGQSLPVSVSVPFFIFNFHLWASVRIWRQCVWRLIVFSALLVLMFRKLLIYKFSAKLGFTYYFMCYIMYSRYHIRGRWEIKWNSRIFTFMHFSATELALRCYLL